MQNAIPQPSRTPHREAVPPGKRLPARVFIRHSNRAASMRNPRVPSNYSSSTYTKSTRPPQPRQSRPPPRRTQRQLPLQCRTSARHRCRGMKRPSDDRRHKRRLPPIRSPPGCLNGLRVRHFQRLRELAQFFASRLQSVPFPEDAPALGAKHQVHHYTVRLRSETKIRRHFTCRANKHQRSVPRLHSR